MSTAYKKALQKKKTDSDVPAEVEVKTAKKEKKASQPV